MHVYQHEHVEVGNTRTMFCELPDPGSAQDTGNVCQGVSMDAPSRNFMAERAGGRNA